MLAVSPAEKSFVNLTAFYLPSLSVAAINGTQPFSRRQEDDGPHHDPKQETGEPDALPNPDPRRRQVCLNPGTVQSCQGG
jgi:hypothetical protein